LISSKSNFLKGVFQKDRIFFFNPKGKFDQKFKSKMGNAQASPESSAQSPTNNSTNTSIFKKKFRKNNNNNNNNALNNAFLDPTLILASSIVGSEEAQVEFESKLADGTSATCYKGY